MTFNIANHGTQFVNSIIKCFFFSTICDFSKLLIHNIYPCIATTLLPIQGIRWCTRMFKAVDDTIYNVRKLYGLILFKYFWRLINQVLVLPHDAQFQFNINRLFLVLTSFSEHGKDSVVIFSFTQYDLTIIYI